MSPHTVIAAVSLKLEGLMIELQSLAGDMMQTGNSGAMPPVGQRHLRGAAAAAWRSRAIPANEAP